MPIDFLVPWSTKTYSSNQVSIWPTTILSNWNLRSNRLLRSNYNPLLRIAYYCWLRIADYWLLRIADNWLIISWIDRRIRDNLRLWRLRYNRWYTLNSLLRIILNNHWFLTNRIQWTSLYWLRLWLWFLFLYFLFNLNLRFLLTW